MASAGPRIGPHGARRFRQGLLATLFGIPVLGGLYGFHRDGGEGAAVGALLGLFAAATLVFVGVRLMNWLRAPRTPPLWPYERLYWSATILAAALALIAVTILLGAFDPIEEHGLDGWIDGLIAGLVCAALVGFIAGRLHAWLMWLKGPQPAEANDYPSRLQDELAPTLAELEAVRLETGRHIRHRAAWMTPTGAVVGFATWAVFALTVEFDLILPAVAFLVGALVGHIIAVRRLATHYEDLYRRRVLPLMVARFGRLTYERPPPPDLDGLRAFHVFPRFDSGRGDNEIKGDYRGLALSLTQLRLKRGWGPTAKTVFRGLFVELRLKNRLTGDVAIAADAGALRNLLDHLGPAKMARVGLESSDFERAFEVYATDQVMARALVTPTFMERLLALGKRPGFGRPLALAQDSHLLLALPQSNEQQSRGRQTYRQYVDFFSPPSFEAPASDDGELQRLSEDIQAVLGAADAVIALDDATSHGAKRRRTPTS